MKEKRKILLAAAVFLSGAFAPEGARAMSGMDFLNIPAGTRAEGMGGGDIKMLAMIGAFLGWLGAQLSVSLSLRKFD